MSTIIEEKASSLGIAKGEYLAPRVKVIEVCMRQVICQSVEMNPGTEEYQDGTWNW